MHVFGSELQPITMVYPAAYHYGLSCSLSLWFILQSITMVYPAAYHYGLSCSLSLWFILQPVTNVYPAAYHCDLSCSLSLWFILQPITVIYHCSVQFLAVRCSLSLWFIVQPITMVCPAAYHCGLSCSLSLRFILQPITVVYPAAYHYGLSCSQSLWFILQTITMVYHCCVYVFDSELQSRPWGPERDVQGVPCGVLQEPDGGSGMPCLSAGFPHTHQRQHRPSWLQCRWVGAGGAWHAPLLSHTVCIFVHRNPVRSGLLWACPWPNILWHGKHVNSDHKLMVSEWSTQICEAWFWFW